MPAFQLSASLHPLRLAASSYSFFFSVKNQLFQRAINQPVKPPVLTSQRRMKSGDSPDFIFHGRISAGRPLEAILHDGVSSGGSPGFICNGKVGAGGSHKHSWHSELCAGEYFIIKTKAK